MRSKALKKFVIVLTLLLVGFIVFFTFPAEADKSRVEFEAFLTVPANTYQYRTVAVYVPAPPESATYVASFAVSNGGIVKFYPFSSGLWQLWQEGTFQPDWVEGNHGDFGMSIQSQTSETIDFYLVVLNDASASQDVKIWLSKTWHESNYLGLFTGSAIVSLGIGIIPLLMFGKKRLHLAYSATIFVMAYLLIAFLSWAYYKSYSPYPPFTFTLIQTIPGVLFFEAFPLTFLLYLLHRNNGFAYFKNWNMGKRLQIPGVFLISGYILPLVFMVFRMVSLSLYWPLDPDELTTFSVTIGGLLMLTGLMIFIGLLATHYRRKSLVQFQR
jgi:hypothetical protein